MTFEGVVYPESGTKFIIEFILSAGTSIFIDDRYFQACSPRLVLLVISRLLIRVQVAAESADDIIIIIINRKRYTLQRRWKPMTARAQCQTSESAWESHSRPPTTVILRLFDYFSCLLTIKVPLYFEGNL